MIASCECVLKECEALKNLICGVNIERRSEPFCERFKRDFAAVKCATGLRMVKRTGRCFLVQDELPADK